MTAPDVADPKVLAHYLAISLQADMPVVAFKRAPWLPNWLNLLRRCVFLHLHYGVLPSSSDLAKT
jgi:hypothetical protein